jgi:predicted enzyme related to lactoylglutathione lyase
LDSTGEIGVIEHHGQFAWYELMTTDVASAKAFYAEVVGWSAEDASTPGLPYTVFTAGKASVGGLMDLPEEARKMGATPKWMGYVGVSDIEVTAERIKRLGGAVYVPPTNSNIGRISVVADPHTATFALVKGLKTARHRSAESGKPGRVGWHELLATDWQKAFAFYRELFGWQMADAEISPGDTYQLFSAGGQTIGSMFNKTALDAVPFWLFYFNVDDIDAAAGRVRTAGGEVVADPMELTAGSWIARCRDPQGAAFAIQGKRNEEGIAWSAKWGEFSSRGKLVTKPRA